jgi:uncharacterized membrane protein YhaH (DUF805 family)
MELMFQPLRKYADFRGRAQRAEYWLFYLLFMIVYVTLIVASGGFDEHSSGPTGVGLVVALIAGLGVLGMLIPMIAVQVRRLHDTNRSGWWLFIGFIPLIGGLVLFVFTVLDSTPGRNRFGPNPKTGATEDVSVFS